MSFASLSRYQVALAALLPKPGTGATAPQLAAAGNLPLDLVKSELQQLVDAGLATHDLATGEYRSKPQEDGYAS
jgi:hypothetical protein